MAHTINIETTLVTEICCNCGMLFAMPEEIRKRRLGDKNWFYCPSGHAQHYTGETHEQEVRRLKREIANERENVRIAKAAAKTVAKELNRQKQRSKGGACPCCNRTFVQLARHMKSQHPEYAAT